MALNDSKKLTANTFLAGIKQGDPAIIHQFYSEYFNSIADFIIRNKGSVDDAKDIFQDAIMIIYQKAQNVDFQLKHSLHTYFYAICKNLWYQRLKRKKNTAPLLHDFDSFQEDITILDAIEDRNKQQLFFSKFAELKTPCQTILKLFFAKKSMQEITEQLNLSSVGYAKKRKYLCQKKLLELIKADPVYKELCN